MVAAMLCAGCSSRSTPSATSSQGEVAEENSTAGSTPPTIAEAAERWYEFSAEDLLSARLPEQQAAEGWLRLFDGHTLFGWEIAGEANWRVEEGAIVVDEGQQGLLCTSVAWRDYELVLEFKAGPQTNSGVFLRTPLAPEDPATECYEVNIAPDDNPFPTAGIVKRKKADSLDDEGRYDRWREMSMRLEGDHLQVRVDGKLVCDYTDPHPLGAGRIGLQHNQGRVEFRNIRLRPLGLASLLDSELTQWTKYPQMPGEFTTTEEGWLHVQGGRTQLESKQSYDDFVLKAEYKLPSEEMNSGIFFRCVAGSEMDGYECQVSDQMLNGDPLSPADHGTGGIFRRQVARLVAGQRGQWTTVVLVAQGTRMAAWVAGVQVSDWSDDRQPNENPRRGQRTEAGTIMIQGHDPGTDALFKQFAIAPL